MEQIILNIASFNVRGPCDEYPYNWENRRSRVRQIFKDFNFHICGLQEPFKNQVDDIVADSVYAYIGGGRDDFKDAGEHSCIVYDTTRLELLTHGMFGLSESPDIPGVRSWGSAHPRIATWGRFKDNISGKELILYNTHLDDISELARVNGIKMVVEHARKHAAGVPMILEGDFNAFPDSETYAIAAELLKDSQYTSESGHKGSGRTFHGYGRDRDRDEPIDYIFTTGNIRVHSHETVNFKPDGDFASDHFPVLAQISF